MPKLLHLDCQLYQVICGLVENLGFPHGRAPYIDTMSTNNDCASRRVLAQDIFQIRGQIFLVGGVLNNRDHEGVEEPEIARLGDLGKSLDLLNVGNSKLFCQKEAST